jgi:hypothetical protein
VQKHLQGVDQLRVLVPKGVTRARGGMGRNHRPNNVPDWFGTHMGFNNHDVVEKSVRMLVEDRSADALCPL